VRGVKHQHQHQLKLKHNAVLITANAALVIADQMARLVALVVMVMTVQMVSLEHQESADHLHHQHQFPLITLNNAHAKELKAILDPKDQQVRLDPQETVDHLALMAYLEAEDNLDLPVPLDLLENRDRTVHLVNQANKTLALAVQQVPLDHLENLEPLVILAQEAVPLEKTVVLDLKAHLAILEIQVPMASLAAQVVLAKMASLETLDLANIAHLHVWDRDTKFWTWNAHWTLESNCHKIVDLIRTSA